MDSRRRGGSPGDTGEPVGGGRDGPGSGSPARRAGSRAVGPQAPPREGTGALRLWSEDPLRDGTPPFGSVGPTFDDPKIGAAPGPEPAISAAVAPELQVADDPTQPDVAIWDRALVAEPKVAPGIPALQDGGLILGPDSVPLAQVDDRLGPTVAAGGGVHTGEISAMVAREAGRKRLVVAALAAALLLGSAAAIFAYRYFADASATDELAQALRRSDSDTAASNLETLEALESLHRREPDRTDVIDALAERSALYALRFDPTSTAAERAAELGRRRERGIGLAVARAVTALLAGDRQRAAAIASRGIAAAASSRPGRAALAYVRAHTHLQALDLDDALADLRLAEKHSSGWGAPLALRAEAERLAGRLVDARESIARLRRVAPQSTELPIVEALVEVDAALISMSAEALEASRRAVGEALATNDSRARAPAARLRLALARLALARGDAVLALETVRPVQDILRGDPELLRVKAQALSANGAPEEALEALAASARADLDARWLRVLVLLQLERPEAALEAASDLGSAGTRDREAVVHEVAAWSSFALAAGGQERPSAAPADGRPEGTFGPEAQAVDDADLARIEALSETGEWNDVRAAVLALGARKIRRCGQAILSAMWANDARAREAVGGDARTLPPCAVRMQGRLALAAGEIATAVVFLRKAADSGRPSDRVALAEGIWKSDGGVAAVAEARRALEMKPTAPRTLVPLVDMLARLGAAEPARQAAELAADEPVRLALLARSARLGGDASQASRILAEPGAGRWADHPLVALESLQAAVARGDHAAATVASPNALRVPASLWLEAVQATVQALRASGREDHADALVDGELQAASNRGDRRRVHGLRLLRARMSVDRGDPGGLHRASNDVAFVETQMHSPSAEAQVLMARLALTRGERTEAVRLYRAALAIDPTRKDAYAALEELHALGRADEALRDRSWPTSNFD